MIKIYIYKDDAGRIGYKLPDGTFTPIHFLQNNQFRIHAKTAVTIDAALGRLILVANNTKISVYQFIPKVELPVIQPQEPRQLEKFHLVFINERGWFLEGPDGTLCPFQFPQNKQAVYYSGGGGGGKTGVNVQEEGVDIGFKTTLNFIGTGVTAVNVGGGVAEINIPGGLACAQNGLSISGGCVELGGNPLMHDTTIDFDVFNLNFQNVPASTAAVSILTLDAGGNIQTVPSGGTNGLFLALNGNTTAGEYIGTNNVQDFPIYTSGIERARVLSTGELGYGTSAPSVFVEFFNNQNAITALLLNNPNAGATSSSLFVSQSETATGIFGTASDGFVNPVYAGNVFLRADNTNLVLYAFDDMIFATGGGLGERMRILSTGEIGINTAPVVGTQVTVQGSGTTNVTFIEQWYNATPTLMFAVRDDGYISAGLTAGNLTIGFNSFFSPLVNNTFIGVGIASVGVVTGETNTALGRLVLRDLTSGTANTAVGDLALLLNTTGSFNTAIGLQALEVNSIGEFNTGVGYRAVEGNTTANQNTGIGASALRGITTGGFNTSIGVTSLLSNSVGVNNTAVGVSALFNILGNSNTAIGFNAGFTNTGDNGVFVGNQAGFYETVSSKLFIDNIARSHEADGRAKALVYGGFASTTAAQWFTHNSNVGIGTSTFGTSADFVLGIMNGTEPTTSPADMIQIFSVNVDTGGTNLASLGLRTEQAVEAVGLSLADSKIRVKINGTEYFILLDTA